MTSTTCLTESQILLGRIMQQQHGLRGRCCSCYKRDCRSLTIINGCMSLLVGAGLNSPSRFLSLEFPPTVNDRINVRSQMKTAYLINTPSTMLICIQTYAPYDNYSKILGISKKEAHNFSFFF